MHLDLNSLRHCVQVFCSGNVAVYVAEVERVTVRCWREMFSLLFKCTVLVSLERRALIDTALDDDGRSTSTALTVSKRLGPVTQSHTAKITDLLL